MNKDQCRCQEYPQFNMSDFPRSIPPLGTPYPPPIFIFACGNLQIIMNPPEINNFRRLPL